MGKVFSGWNDRYDDYECHKKPILNGSYLGLHDKFTNFSHSILFFSLHQLPFAFHRRLGATLTFGFLFLWLQDRPTLSSSGEGREREGGRGERGTCSLSSTEQVEKATGLI